MIRKKISFVLTVASVLAVLSVGTGYCLDLDEMKAHFLAGDYKAAITEGEKILASSGNSSGMDDLYYILGLSYLKEGNYLRASDIFEIILKEFKNSKLKDEAQLALGDTFFLRNDFKEALSHYQELLRDNPDTGLKAQALFRLSESEFKLGDSSLGKEYLDKLKQEFSLNPELKLDKDLFGASDSSGKTVYTVQVGSFSSNANAAGLTQKLIQLGYPAYLEEVVSMEAPIYKVRVGKFSSLQEAKDTQDKLSAAGFPTKLCP